MPEILGQLHFSLDLAKLADRLANEVNNRKSKSGVQWKDLTSSNSLKKLSPIGKEKPPYNSEGIATSIDFYLCQKIAILF